MVLKGTTSYLPEDSLVKFKKSGLTPFFKLKDFILKNNWSPSLFKEDYRDEAHWRMTNLLTIDIDGGFTLEQAQEKFKDHIHIIGTTRHHQVEKKGVTCDRFRVLLVLENFIVLKEDYQATWEEFYKDNQYIDTACRDVARFYFKCSTIVSYKEDGLKIPIVKAQPPQPLTLLSKHVPPATVNRIQRLAGKGTLSKKTQNILTNGCYDEGTRHSDMVAAVGDFRNQEYSKQDALTQLGPMTNLSQKEFQGIVDRIYAKPPKYPKRVGSIAKTLGLGIKGQK